MSKMKHWNFEHFYNYNFFSILDIMNVDSVSRLFDNFIFILCDLYSHQGTPMVTPK